MIVWLSRVGQFYYKVTLSDDGMFLLSHGTKDDGWAQERREAQNTKDAIRWISDSDIENDILIGETTW